jgi:hypothetical protein
MIGPAKIQSVAEGLGHSISLPQAALIVACVAAKMVCGKNIEEAVESCIALIL